MGTDGARTGVLFWVPLPPPCSGPEIASALLVEELQRRSYGFAVGNATCRSSIMRKGRIDFAGVAAFLQSYGRFLPLLLKRDHKVLYMVAAPGGVGFLRDTVMIWTAALAGKRIVLHMRGGNHAKFYQSSPAPLKWLIRRTWGKAAHAIVQSPMLRDLVVECAPGVKASVVPNGLPNTPPPVQTPTPHPEGPVTLLFLGYLAYTKGFYDLMSAYKALHRKYGDKVRLRFAGELPHNGAQFSTFLSGSTKRFYLSHLSSIEKEIKEFVDLAPQFNAEYLGIVSGEAKQNMFRDADIFVLPSYMEGFSMAILEAMFAGVPIVTTRVGASPEIIAEGLNGHLVSPGEPQQLEEALRRLIEDKECRQRMGALNAAEARQKYSIERVADDIIDILDNYEPR